MNDFREKLNRSKTLLGCVITYPCPGIIECIGDDWDWFWIDCQHGELGYRDMLELVRAADLAGCGSMVRVPSHEPGWIGLALDMACSGIIVPQVEDVDQARRVVRAAKFPPLGNRSCGGRRPVDLLGRGYVDSANRGTFVMVQLESPEAIEKAAEIAAVDGIDCLLIGPGDVKLRLGYSLNDPRPEDEELAEIEALVRVCREHEKMVGVFGATGEQLARCVALGVDLVANGCDAHFLSEASGKRSAESREIIENQGRGGRG